MMQLQYGQDSADATRQKMHEMWAQAEHDRRVRRVRRPRPLRRQVGLLLIAWGTSLLRRPHDLPFAPYR